MSVQLSIDLSDATFADLRALVDAARTAGVDSRARLEFEDTTLIVTADGTVLLDRAPEAGQQVVSAAVADGIAAEPVPACTVTGMPQSCW